MVISPRILIKRAEHLQTHQDNWGVTNSPGLGEKGRHTNQIEFPYKAKQQGN